MANKKTKPNSYPLITLRNLVVYPKMILPLFVGREKSINALHEGVDRDGEVVLLTQKNENSSEPGPKDAYNVGIKVKVIQSISLEDGNYKVLVEGLERVEMTGSSDAGDYFEVTVNSLEDIDANDEKILKAQSKLVMEMFRHYTDLNPKVPSETLMSLTNIDEHSRLLDMVASYLIVETEEKQTVLEALDLLKRAELIHHLLVRENETLEMEKDLEKQVKGKIEKVQKEVFLKEKIKAIQAELGDEEFLDDVEEYREKIAAANMPEDVQKKAVRELTRLKNSNPLSSEQGVIRAYLDWLVELPWNVHDKTESNLQKVAKQLDKSHFGLDKIKESILEFIAVYNLTKKMHGSILCLSGPPGVGKTSVASAIAESMGRKFISIALGGVHDVSELRGHRRTYVGSMPSRLIQAINKIGVNNPVILLDEVDKMTQGFQGDPAAAMLEILDPEQNKNFHDNFLEVPFDLSDVLFIATANDMASIPPQLRNRMEVMNLSGYTEDEKITISKQFIIPKIMEDTGVTDKDINFTPTGIHTVIKEYTREAGLRELQRQIQMICRKVARVVLEKGVTPVKIVPAKVRELLGVQKYLDTGDRYTDKVGVSRGLAWTASGGDVMPIEVAVLSGSSQLLLTGNMGDVMQESAKTAMSYVRFIADDLGLDEKFYKKIDLHIHIPEGAVPKDGPSAGITLATAIISALTDKPVHNDIAMTGEVTLRGQILPIGGVKEKLIAAYSYGIKKIVLPEENRKDMENVPAKVREGLRINYVKDMKDVLKIAIGNVEVKEEPEEISIDIEEVEKPKKDKKAKKKKSKKTKSKTKKADISLSDYLK